MARQTLNNPLLEEPQKVSGAINPLLSDVEGPIPPLNPLLEEPTTEPPAVLEEEPLAQAPSRTLPQQEGSTLVRGEIDQLQQLLIPEERPTDMLDRAMVRASEMLQQRRDTILYGETPAEQLGITGAAEVAGGVVVGGAEWLAQNIMGMAAGAYTKFVTDKSGEESLEYGNKVAQEVLTGLKEAAPDTWQRFLGAPETPQAQEALEGLGALLEATVVPFGDVGAEFVGGYLRGIADLLPEGTAQTALTEAVPWAEQIGRFGTELIAFKKGHEVGRYVAEKVRRRERPPSRAEVTPERPEVLDLLQEDFKPAEAARRVAKEIDDTLSSREKAELQALAKQEVQRNLRDYDLSVIESDLKAGRIGPDIAKSLRENIEVQEKQLAERTKVERASTEYVSAIEAAKIPADVIPAAMDPATNRPIPFGNRAAASVRARTLAKEGTLTEPVRVPGTKYHALRILEDQRIIRTTRNKPFTLKGAQSRQRTLERQGTKTELRNIEGGYELRVTSYSKEAAAKRTAQLREEGITYKHSGIPPDDIARRVLRAAGRTFDIDRLTRERAKWLRGVEEGRRLRAAQAIRDEGKSYIYMHSGIPIPPDIAGKIRRYARERGTSVMNVLRKKGYSDSTAGKMVSHIEEMGKIYESNLAAGIKAKDTNANRAALRKRALMLAEANGLLTTRPIKKGRPVGQFSVQEVQAFLATQDLPLSTPLRDATRRMKQAGLSRQTRLEYKDRGFKSFVEATTGKPWSKNLDVSELTALANAMTTMRQTSGRFILKQEGGQPPITEVHLDMMGKISHVKPQGAIEGTTWFANRLDTAAPGFAREFINPILTAENTTVHEVMINRHRLKQFVKENKITMADREAIGTWAVSKQEGGSLILESMNKTAKPLTKKQAQLYEYIREEIFEPLFTRINEARAKQNKDPMKYTENYFTFFRDLTALAEDGIHVLGSSQAALKQRITKARQVAFRHLKARKGSKLPVELDALRVAEKYMLSATHYVHTSPPLNRLRTLLDSGFSRKAVVTKHGEAAWPESVQHLKAFNLAGINAPLYEGFNAWLNHVAGVPVKDAGWRTLNKVATVLNTNLAYSVLSYNLGSVARQFGAWRNTWHATSTRDMIGGMYDAARDFAVAEKGARFGERAKLRGAFAKSDRLASRVFDATVRHTLDVLEGRRDTGSLMGYLYHKLGRAGLRPLAATDAIAARVAYYALERQGRRQGLKGQELREYIDRGIIETQGSGTKVEVPPIMRTPAGRTLALFQTYVLNDWNYLNRRVFGRGSKKPTYQKVASLLYYVYVTAAMSMMFEALGVRSPFPTPIDAFADAQERGATPPEALARSAFELVEPVPFIGGAIRFGTSLGGPVISTGSEIAAALHGDPFSPPLLVSAAKLMGVPGTTAFYNGYRQLAKDTDRNVQGRRRTRRRTSRRVR